MNTCQPVSYTHLDVYKRQDFAILDRDCFASSDPTDIRDAKVTTTVLGGKVVYEA